MRIEDAQAPVDELVGTGVDTVAYGLGNGPVMLHDTKVGEIWGTRLADAGGAFDEDTPSSLYALSSWRAYENVKSLIDRGLDPLNVLIERAHEKGLEFIASLRQTNQTDPSYVHRAQIGKFKVDHPDLCLKGRGKHAFNWVHPEVRAERLAIAEETVSRYDVDGFEVDWVYHPFFFEDGEEERNTPILTEYMRDIHSAAGKAASSRGRPLSMGARVCRRRPAIWPLAST